MSGMTIPMPSTPVDPELILYVCMYYGWIGSYLLPPRLTSDTYLIFLQEVLGELLKVSLDISGFNTISHYPILQVQFVITLTDVLG